MTDEKDDEKATPSHIAVFDSPEQAADYERRFGEWLTGGMIGPPPQPAAL